MLAALDYNHHADRGVATNKEGDVQYYSTINKLFA